MEIFYLSLDKTIATLVEISLLNFEGGISAVIPSNLSGKIKLPFLDKSNKIFFILSKYCQKYSFNIIIKVNCISIGHSRYKI